MNQFAIVLVLALASTNASKFNRSPGGGFHQVRARSRYTLPHDPPMPQTGMINSDSGNVFQEKASREYPEEPFYGNDGIDEEQHLGIFLPKFNSEVENFEPPPKSFTQFRGSRLYDSDEFKMKRSDASLSIVNALDVLRQRIMMEFARRKMNESKAQIQKNRELLMKTGKRSQEESEEPSNYRIPQTLLWKRSQNEDLEKALPVASSESFPDAKTIQTQSGYQT